MEDGGRSIAGLILQIAVFFFSYIRVSVISQKSYHTQTDYVITVFVSDFRHLTPQNDRDFPKSPNWFRTWLENCSPIHNLFLICNGCTARLLTLQVLGTNCAVVYAHEILAGHASMIITSSETAQEHKPQTTTQHNTVHV